MSRADFLARQLQAVEAQLQAAQTRVRAAHHYIGMLEFENEQLREAKRQAELADDPPDQDEVRIIFDRPPGHDAPRLVEVEDRHGRSISVGEWYPEGNGMWSLRIPVRTCQPLAALRRWWDRFRP